MARLVKQDGMKGSTAFSIPDDELCSQKLIVLNSSQVTISKLNRRADSWTDLAKSGEASSRDQFQRYGHNYWPRKLTKRRDWKGKFQKGGERGKFCQTNPRSAVTHILKKKGCNSVREHLTEALLSQRGTLSLWPSVTIPDPHTEQGKVLWGSPGLHLDPSPPLCSLLTGRTHYPGRPTDSFIVPDTVYTPTTTTM